MKISPCHKGSSLVRRSNGDVPFYCSCCRSVDEPHLVHLALRRGQLPATHWRFCESCVKTMRTAPMGRESRRRPNGLKMIVKRFISKTGGRCEVGQRSFTGEAVALHRDNSMAVVCAQCVADMIDALTTTQNDIKPDKRPRPTP